MMGERMPAAKGVTQSAFKPATTENPTLVLVKTLGYDTPASAYVGNAEPSQDISGWTSDTLKPADTSGSSLYGSWGRSANCGPVTMGITYIVINPDNTVGSVADGYGVGGQYSPARYGAWKSFGVAVNYNLVNNFENTIQAIISQIEGDGSNSYVYVFV